MSNKARLTLICDASRLLGDASRKFAEAEAETPPNEVDGADIRIRSALSAAASSLAALQTRLEREEEERRKRFDSVPVLQAMLRFSDGTTRRVAVSKPTDAIDEPYIGEMFYAALKKQGVVASCEAWPVLVVDRRGRIVAKIQQGK